MKLSLCTTFALLTTWTALFDFASAVDSNAISPLVKIETQSGDNDERSLQSSRCGCSSCSSSVLNRDARGHKVGARIDWLKKNRSMSEQQACAAVCSREFPSICGACNPDSCSGGGPPPTPPSGSGTCGCSSCTSSILNRDARGHKVGARIDWLKKNRSMSEQQACAAVCSREFPNVCGACNPDSCSGGGPPEPTPTPPSPTPPSGGGICGCSSCTSSILNRDARGHKVGARINWLKKNRGMSEQQACMAVCSREFPNVCGACNPSRCGGGGGGPGPTPTPQPPTPPTGSSCSRNTLKFVNQSNKSVWIYDFPYNSPNGPKQPVGGGPVAAGASVCVPMTRNRPGMRVYVANRRLRNSMERGVAPDSGNSSVDGNVMFSFFEYFLEENQRRYTVDLSYIDEYSFPLTVKFDEVGGYRGAVEGHEYGPKSLSSIKNALAREKDFNWSSLIWPGMNRIVGPLKVWQYNPSTVPSSFSQFTQSLPKHGRQLFRSRSNWDGWNQLMNREPSNTGYVRALHSVTIPDSRGKYGYFCYPIDNRDGEFTWMPVEIKTTVTIYPDNS